MHSSDMFDEKYSGIKGQPRQKIKIGQYCWVEKTGNEKHRISVKKGLYARWELKKKQESVSVPVHQYMNLFRNSE